MENTVHWVYSFIHLVGGVSIQVGVVACHGQIALIPGDNEILCSSVYYVRLRENS